MGCSLERKRRVGRRGGNQHISIKQSQKKDRPCSFLNDCNQNRKSPTVFSNKQTVMIGGVTAGAPWALQTNTVVSEMFGFTPKSTRIQRHRYRFCCPKILAVTCSCHPYANQHSCFMHDCLMAMFGSCAHGMIWKSGKVNKQYKCTAMQKKKQKKQTSISAAALIMQDHEISLPFDTFRLYIQRHVREMISVNPFPNYGMTHYEAMMDSSGGALHYVSPTNLLTSTAHTDT